MLQGDFNNFFICNFNNLVKIEDIPYEGLQLLWRNGWNVESVKQSILRLIDAIDTVEVVKENVKRLLCDCIQMVLLFVQYNFTGPFTQIENYISLIKDLQLIGYEPFSGLNVSGEEINPNVKCGELFVIAKLILEKIIKVYPESIVLLWWRLRLICLHQQILDDLSNDLYQQFKDIAEKILKHTHINDAQLMSLLYIEVANGYLLYHRADISLDLINKLCKELNVELNVEGLLGVRTKFQQKPLPQLCLKVVQNSQNLLPAAFLTNGKTELPKLLLLDDDTRLESIRFITESDNEIMTLPSILQILVLSKVKLLKRSQPKDRLADEELEPYIQTLLYQSYGPLQVRQSALLLNCMQESTMRRTVERSWKQCEECLMLMEKDEKYNLLERLSYGFASFLQPKWQIQMQLCDLQRSLGLTKSALDIYLKIQAWEQVIECYSSLELRHKAAEIIRQELLRKPTALLYCLLGDAEDDPKFYEDAWNFSKCKSGKAQAYWGNYYFRRSEYENAIEHYEKSLEINKLQEKILLRYGYCAIQLELWQNAVHAYISYTHLEPNGFESWNNLAKALINVGDKERAHKVLGESLKCNYNNWKVWENFMLVSVDTGHLDDAIRAYTRLSEIKNRFLDLEVLTIIIKEVLKSDISENELTPIRKKAINLMGQQCIKFGNEPLIWELASHIAPTCLKKAEKLVKCYRAYTVKEKNWFLKKDIVMKILNICIEFCNFSLKALEENVKEESQVMILSQLNSSRLSALSCKNALKRNQAEYINQEQQSLQTTLDNLIDKIEKIIT